MTYVPREGECGKTRGGRQVMVDKIDPVCILPVIGHFCDGGWPIQWNWLMTGHALSIKEDYIYDLVGPWEETNSAPMDDGLQALIKPLWKTVKPSHDAQMIKSKLSVAVDDDRFKQWALDFAPDYVWDLVDIAAQWGIEFGQKGKE
jgi:hypothetical protein